MIQLARLVAYAAQQRERIHGAIFALVTILLGGVGLAASYLPAMRATKADPTMALGHRI